MGLSPIPYFLHLISVSMYAGIQYDVPETIHALRVQIDFVSAEVQLSVVQLLKHHHEVVLVLFDCGRVNKDVVQVYMDEACDVFSEYHGHQPLKG